LNFKYFAVLILVIAVLAGGAYYSYEPLQEAITLGLDIRGGITVLLEAVPTEDVPVINDDAMSRAVAIITQRVNGLGVAEAEVVREGRTRIRVSLPDFDNQEDAMSILGQTARLEFRDEQLELIGVSGDNLRDARERLDERNQPYVSITLDSEGGRVMREFTSANIGKLLVITLDGQPISIPRIEGAVGVDGQISGIGSLQEARNLAIMLRSGALPVKLDVRDFRAVGPSLGMSSLLQSVYAGQVGLILVVLFMILFYRGFGFAANLALAGYVLIVLWVLAAINATLTLPGVAGIILGIGMAVDANVIIFERIKEEMRGGRTLRVAINAGFRRAIWTVMDANITTLIGAGVLFWFGTGPVRGFAVTLSISIGVSMLSAILMTRGLMMVILNAKLVKSSKALGGV
jgi:preprotein translocase subunit SecD